MQAFDKEISCFVVFFVNFLSYTYKERIISLRMKTIRYVQKIVILWGGRSTKYLLVNLVLCHFLPKYPPLCSLVVAASGGLRGTEMATATDSGGRKSTSPTFLSLLKFSEMYGEYFTAKPLERFGSDIRKVLTFLPFWDLHYYLKYFRNFTKAFNLFSMSLLQIWILVQCHTDTYIKIHQIYN